MPSDTNFQFRVERRPVAQQAAAATATVLRLRYGSHMDIVQLGLEAWKEIGLLYAEWRTPWASSTLEYQEERAFELLKCAVRLSKAMKA